MQVKRVIITMAVPKLYRGIFQNVKKYEINYLECYITFKK